MTDFVKIKRMVDDYEKHLADHNERFKATGMTENLIEDGKILDEEFSLIVDEVTVSVNNLIRGLSNSGVLIRDVDVIDGGRSIEPYHSVFLKIGHFQNTFMGGCASKHFTVEGFPYYPKREE